MSISCIFLPSRISYLETDKTSPSDPHKLASLLFNSSFPTDIVLSLGSSVVVAGSHICC